MAIRANFLCALFKTKPFAFFWKKENKENQYAALMLFTEIAFYARLGFLNENRTRKTKMRPSREL